jgi:hypothetical protein
MATYLKERISASTLTLEQMKQAVRDHFEDFVNRRNAAVIHKNMAPNFYDHDGPGGKAADADIDERMMLNMTHRSSSPGSCDRRFMFPRAYFPLSTAGHWSRYWPMNRLMSGTGIRFTA